METRQAYYKVHMIDGRQFLRLYDVQYVSPYWTSCPRWTDYHVSSDFVFDLYRVGFFDPPDDTS